MLRRALVFGLLLGACTALAAVVAVRAQGSRSLERWVLLGAPLLEVRAPLADRELPVGGAAVVVHFPDRERVLPGTFRCLLNGRDVTSQLTVGGNGAGGSVFPLQQGANRLRVEVFGSGLWSAGYLEDAVEVDFPVRAPFPLDRA
jgi:hypothetical protein